MESSTSRTESPNKRAYRQYKSELEKSSEIQYPDYSYSYNLISKLGGVSLLPEEHRTAYKVLSSFQQKINIDIRNKHLSRDGKIVEYDDSVDWKNELKIFKEEFLDTVRDQRSIVECKIIIVEKAIKQRESEIVGDDELISEIERLAVDMDDERFLNERTVHLIYNDGSITSQKGGELFGRRTEFIDKPSLILPEITFPRRSGKMSYSIISLEDAHKLRHMMEKLAV